MSNLTVLRRLEESFRTHESGAISLAHFVRILRSGIEAVEDVPYRTRVELRAQVLKIEIEGYYEEEGFESKLVQAKKALASRINSLMVSCGT